jgi:hypothetical protein
MEAISPAPVRFCVLCNLSTPIFILSPPFNLEAHAHLLEDSLVDTLPPLSFQHDPPEN